MLDTDANFFSECRDVLANPALLEKHNRAVNSFVHALLPDGVELSQFSNQANEERDDILALLNLAAECEQVFQLPMSNAPGAIFAGATFGHKLLKGRHFKSAEIYSSGAGTTWREAFMSCLGEATEILSFIEHRDDPLKVPKLKSTLLEPSELAWAKDGIGVGQDIELVDWISANSLANTNKKKLFPFDLVIRRTEERQEGNIPAKSIGLGAGSNIAQATMSGVLECIERDAIALWWYGGLEARRIVLRDGTNSIIDFSRQIRGNGDRQLWFLDLTTDLGVPVIAAVSSNANGGEISTGFSARPNSYLAMQSALLEMCQMETAKELSLAKQRAGRPLQVTDKAWITRNETIIVPNFPELCPSNTISSADITACSTDLHILCNQIGKLGFPAYFVDITREALGIACVKVLVPGLQTTDTGWVTDRLQSTCVRNGGSIENITSRISPL